jgi:hypothetical protein
MGRTEEYRRHAEAAERRAHEAASERERDAYRTLAERWRELIRQIEQSERRGV